MSGNTQTIEIDEAIATVLAERAAERGVSVSQLVADLMSLDSEPVAADPEEIAELDRRSKMAEIEGTVPHDEVVKWLRTWGTPEFRRWHER